MDIMLPLCFNLVNQCLADGASIYQSSSLYMYIVIKNMDHKLSEIDLDYVISYTYRPTDPAGHIQSYVLLV